MTNLNTAILCVRNNSKLKDILNLGDLAPNVTYKVEFLLKYKSGELTTALHVCKPIGPDEKNND